MMILYVSISTNYILERIKVKKKTEGLLRIKEITLYVVNCLFQFYFFSRCFLSLGTRTIENLERKIKKKKIVGKLKAKKKRFV